MTNDQARRCPMTFDPVKGHFKVKGVKNQYFLPKRIKSTMFHSMFTILMHMIAYNALYKKLWD